MKYLTHGYEFIGQKLQICGIHHDFIVTKHYGYPVDLIAAYTSKS